MAVVFPGQLWGERSGGDTGNLAGISADLFGLVQGLLLIGKRKVLPVAVFSKRSASPNDLDFLSYISLKVVSAFFFFYNTLD